MVKTKLQIALLLITCLMMGSLTAQNTTNKEKKLKKAEILSQIKTLVARGQVDSMLNYVRDQNGAADTSVQVYETTNSKGGVMEMLVVDGDTMYVYNMEPFAVVDLQPYGNPEKDLMFKRLRWHVRKVYPYAKVAGEKLKMYNEEIRTVKSNRKKKKLMKLREKTLKEEFEDVIKTMSKTSGRVLIKLIDRETGESTYEIIKEMRGTFKAWTYQGLGKLYGTDLKQRYNPETSEEDEMIERVVQSLIAEGEDMH